MLVTTRTLTEITLLDAVEVLVSAIDVRNCSFGHSVRVASYAVQIAEACGWQEQVLEEIRLGALLHEIGQVYWPEEQTKKKGKLFIKENEKIKKLNTYKEGDLL